MVILQKFETPTDIYILGIHSCIVGEMFSIIDDYHSVTVASDTKHSYLETSGFLYILTHDMLKNKNTLKSFIDEDLDEDSYTEGILIKDYVGEIKLKIINNLGVDIINNDNFIDNDYLSYHLRRIGELKDKTYIDDYILDIGSGYEVNTVRIGELINKFR